MANTFDNIVRANMAEGPKTISPVSAHTDIRLKVLEEIMTRVDTWAQSTHSFDITTEELRQLMKREQLAAGYGGRPHGLMELVNEQYAKPTNTPEYSNYKEVPIMTFDEWCSTNSPHIKPDILKQVLRKKPKPLRFK